MKIHRRIRQIPEALGIGLALITVPFLPRRAVLLLASGLGNMGYALAGTLRDVARANLDLAYGDGLSAREKEQVARASCRTFALLLLDLFWFAYRTSQRLARHVSIGPDVHAALKLSPSVIVCGHLGNWEVAGRTVSWLGYSLTSIAAPLKNPVADRFLNRVRRATGQEIVAQDGAVRALIRSLRRGGRACLLVDQNTVPGKGGVFVDLFGVPVPMSRAPAMLCLRANAALVFGYCVVKEGGNYVFEASRPVRPGDDGWGDETRLLEATARFLEAGIRRHPEQWLWMYKRWKFVPEGVDSDRYPYYSRRLSQREAGEPGAVARGTTN